MRVLLFMAALGVVMGGAALNKNNPAATVFQTAAGDIGYKIFGVVLWSAAITSVVGSAYTSVSFLRTLHPFFNKYQRGITTAFILISTIVFAFIGRPVKVLIVVGALNGLILPVSLGVLLTAVLKKKLVGDYKHQLWMSIAGWIVVIIMTIMGLKVILTDLL